jgi:hypothetical protein
MAIDTVKAKLHEARSFLNEMQDEEKKAAGETRYYDCLSALLSAGQSVDYRLRCEYPATYPVWRKKWNAQHPAEDRLLEFLHNKRGDEVHGRGSCPSVETEEIKVGTSSSYSDKAGTLQGWGSPSTLTGVQPSAATFKRKHFFNVFGTERSVTEVCAEYLTMLEQMVVQFEADTPRPD